MLAGLPTPCPARPCCSKRIGWSGWLRLAHVSSARTFFVLTHGSKQRQTISMTYRMLSRLCESGRFRAFENAYLLDRATVRARRQLAQLKPSS